MQYVLFDDTFATAFYPFTLTRPVSHLRIGIDTIIEKWSRLTNSEVGCVTNAVLQPKFGVLPAEKKQVTFVNGRFLPNEYLLKLLTDIHDNEIVMLKDNTVLAFRMPGDNILVSNDFEKFAQNLKITYLDSDTDLFQIKALPDIFRLNNAVLQKDFAEITAGRKSNPIADKHTIVYGQDNIFVEEGVKIRAAILNAESGPIYIGKDVEIQEGAMIHGAHALCTHSVVNMGAKLRGDSTIGPWCKVGGEVSNSVFYSYSNKAHDGFVGNSVIGEWCNLGADTNTSNLKNNYGNVQIYSMAAETTFDTGLIFCGLFMGDHSKCSINTMFNTGTVVGVSANIFGADFPPKFVPSFGWGGAKGFETFQLNKAFEVMEKVMARRNLKLTEYERDIFTAIYNECNSNSVF